MGQIPELCNGIKRIDETKDFCKINCEWGKTSKGRKQIPKAIKKKDKATACPKDKIKNPVSICLVLEKDVMDFIRAQAIYKSQQEGTLIEPNSLIREAVYKAFPAPKQFDMFGAKRKCSQLNSNVRS